MGFPPLFPRGYSVTSTISVTMVSVTSVTSVTSLGGKVFQGQGLPSLESLRWKLALLSAALLSGYAKGDLVNSGGTVLLVNVPFREVLIGDGLLCQALSKVLVLLIVEAGELRRGLSEIGVQVSSSLSRSISCATLLPSTSFSLIVSSPALSLTTTSGCASPCCSGGCHSLRRW